MMLLMGKLPSSINLTCTDEVIIVTLDVKALYPSIPIDESIDCVRKMLSHHIDDIDTLGLSIEAVIDCLAFILHNNILRFGHQTYRQVSGVAMGNQVAPPLAIIFMHFLESEAIASAAFKPSLFKRYIDDILMIWRWGMNRLQCFIDHLEGAHPKISFTYEYTSDSKPISYMDVELHIDDNKLHYQLFEKPSDSGNCIPYTSATPQTVKNAFVASYYQRAERLSSTDEMLKHSTQKVEKRLNNNGYPHIRKVKPKKREQRDSAYFKRIAIRLPYKADSLDKKVRRIMNTSGLPLRVIYNTKQHSLGSALVRSALLPQECPALEQKRRVAEESKRRRGRPRKCTTCETVPNKASICRRTGVVYRIDCGLCHGKYDFYIGETGRPLGSRVDDHTSEARLGKGDTPWGKHWSSRHRGIPVVYSNISVIDTAKDVVERKIKESLHIRKLKPAINISAGYRLT